MEVLSGVLKKRRLYEMFEHITGQVTESSDDDQVSINFDFAETYSSEQAEQKVDNRFTAQQNISQKMPDILAE